MTRKIRPDKEQRRRIRVAIRHALLQEWDLIGVKDEPYAEDEYDSYLGDMYELLITGAKDSTMDSYLRWIAEERMGMDQTRVSDRTRTIAALRLISIEPDSVAFRT